MYNIHLHRKTLVSISFREKLNEFMGNAFILHTNSILLSLLLKARKRRRGFLLLIKALTSEGGINCLFYFVIFYNKAKTMLKKFFKAFELDNGGGGGAAVTLITQVFLNFMHTIFSSPYFFIFFSSALLCPGTHTHYTFTKS